METSNMYQITPNYGYNRYREGILTDSSNNIYNTSNIYNTFNSFHPRFNSIIAIGNPIVDISAEIEKEILPRYKLVFGGTFFADENNMGFFDELESKSQVTYIPGGSIQNTLRVTNWCLNMEEQNRGKFKITMLGAIGLDNYKEKIMNALNSAGVKPLLQQIPNISTSRCGVGI